MTAFRFRLERVLRWRALELGLEESKLKRLLGEQTELETKVAGVEAEIAHLPARIAGEAELSGHDLHCMAGYATYLTHERDRIRKRIREKRAEIAAQMKVHAKARQRQRLLEELRARKHSEWQIETNREIEELAQESYLARWAD